MNISTAGIDLIKHFELLRLYAYQDQVGVWTIGYGHTKTAKPGMVITEAKANDLLESDLREKEIGVTRLVKVPLKQREFDALVSFAINLGVSALASSTLLKKLNSGKNPTNEFLRWVMAGGHVAAGLVLRRMAERLLYLNRDWRVIV